MKSVPTQKNLRFMVFLMVFYNLCVYPLCTVQWTANTHAQCLITLARFEKMKKQQPQGHLIRPLHHRWLLRDALVELYTRISALNHHLHNVLAHNMCMRHKRDTWHTSESTQDTRNTLRRRCSRDKTIFTTDNPMDRSPLPRMISSCACSHRTRALCYQTI